MHGFALTSWTRLRAFGLGMALLASLGCSPAPTAPTDSTAPAETVQQPAAGAGPHDLGVLLEEGLVALEGLRGNGASSGNAVEGALRNLSGRDLRVRIALDEPLYFRNSGRGQNMIAAMILGEGGRYASDGRESFLELDGSGASPVSLIAFCADFEKDNPTAAETFTLDAAPPGLGRVASRIAQYMSANPNADVTRSGQVAVWLAQGVSEQEIQEKFPFSAQDAAVARTFLQ